VFRGCGDSPAAVSDIVHLYGERVSTLHLRQSREGKWTETFGAGDLDYPALMRLLADCGFDGPVVLEQIVERDAALALDPGEALRRSVEAARKLPVRG
jgi:inosose dehydratase